jgi:hypothetical protein
MFHPVAIVAVLVLLAVANSTPIAARNLLGDRFATPIDGGTRLPDGQPVFGQSKTIRGIALSIVATALVSGVSGLGWATGAGIAAASMAGDLFSSFLKRRLRLEVHARYIGLDQIPESLVPMLVFKGALRLTWVDILVAVAAFLILELLLSRLLFRLRIRDRPW